MVVPRKRWRLPGPGKEGGAVNKLAALAMAQLIAVCFSGGRVATALGSHGTQLCNAQPPGGHRRVATTLGPLVIIVILNPTRPFKLKSFKGAQGICNGARVCVCGREAFAVGYLASLGARVTLFDNQVC